MEKQIKPSLSLIAVFSAKVSVPLGQNKEIVDFKFRFYKSAFIFASILWH